MKAEVQFAEAVQVAEPAFLARVRLRAWRRALWLQSLWSSDGSTKGLAIAHDEVERILADPSEMAEAELEFYQNNEQTRELGGLIRLADRNAESNERWRKVQELFHLTETETDLLALAAAVVAEPAFARVCGYLQDDATACYATPHLAAALFGWSAEAHVGTDGMLARWRLARVAESSVHPSAPNAPWVADPHVVRWLLGDSPSDSAPPRMTERLSRADVAGLDSLDPGTFNAVREFIAAVRNKDSSHTALPIEIDLIGPSGAGKRTLAAQICASMNADTMFVDAQALLPKDLPTAEASERIFHAARAARLEEAVLYWNRAENMDMRFRRAIEGLCSLTFFGNEVPGAHWATSRAARQSFHIRPLREAQRVQLWKQFTPEPMPDAVREWRLRPAEIRAAAQIACAGREAVLGACRRMLHHEPGEMFTTLQCPYTWDDIVLAPNIRQQLEELCAQARLRSAVLEEWGFERLCRMGQGISALLAGPSGTGKTMAAQVLARELNRELCRVDLAEVVNKYIGETEKRLKRVFDACERSAVVLFFDEADALFGQRTQVKDSHDRYANIQIDYLLQRMEQFDGIALLATNRKSDLDAAFLRRLRFIVDFQPPGPQERLALWRIALAEGAPESETRLEDIDWNWLAANLILTGADIKAIALAAAFLARSQGTRIRMDHLVHGARREMAKHGTAWRAGEWSMKRNG